MAFPQREYHRLESLERRWKNLGKEKITYSIENGFLRICVWLPLSFVEKGYEKPNKHFVITTREMHEGFVSVRPEDYWRICSSGCANLRIFVSIAEEKTLRLAYEPSQDSLSVRIRDLVVLERDSREFERIYVTPDNRAEKQAFIISEDCRYIRLNGKEHHFGDIQAEVVKLLKDGAENQNPWIHSKTLLHGAGSGANRLRDLFKNNRDWQEVIISNKRGYYRLNIPLEASMLSNNQNSNCMQLQQSV